MVATLPAKLTAESFDRLHSRLVTLEKNEALELDLSGLEFAEPAGLVPFACFLRNHIRGGGRVQIRAFPVRETFCGHLHRIGFYKLLGCACNHVPAHKPTDNDKFIAITEISSAVLTEPIKKQLISLTNATVDIKGPTGDSFLTACGELIQNTRHAYNVAVDQRAEMWPGAMLQAQYHRKTNTLHFTVADCGVGVHRSLCAKDPTAYKDAKDSIIAATYLNIRTPIGPGKGVGLAAIRKFMKLNGGRFSIRSGEWSISFPPHKRSSKITVWNGSVVSLEIRGSRKVDIGAIIEGMAKA
jgi:hypothetical protein